MLVILVILIILLLMLLTKPNIPTPQVPYYCFQQDQGNSSYRCIAPFQEPSTWIAGTTLLHYLTGALVQQILVLAVDILPHRPLLS